MPFLHVGYYETCCALYRTFVSHFSTTLVTVVLSECETGCSVEIAGNGMSKAVFHDDYLPSASCWLDDELVQLFPRPQ